MKLVRAVIAVGLLGLFFGATLPAQIASSQEQYFVKGFVREEVGAAIAGASVTIKNMRTSDLVYVTSRGNGYYECDIGVMEHGYLHGDVMKLTCSKSGKRTVDRIAPLDLGMPFMERWFTLYGIADFWYNYKVYDLDENQHSSMKSAATVNAGTAATEVHPDYTVHQHAYLYAEWTMSETNTYNVGQLDTWITFNFEIYDEATPDQKIAAPPITYHDILVPNQGISRNGEIGVTIVPDPRQNDPDGLVYYIPDGHKVITKASIVCSWTHFIIGGNNIGRIDDQDSWTLNAPASWIKVTWMNYR